MTQLQKDGDIASFEIKDNKTIIEMNNKNELTIDFNREGIFVSKPSKSYIVEFKKPAALAQAQSKEGLGIQSYSPSDYKGELESEHSAALRDIEEKINPTELPEMGFWETVVEFIKSIFGITGHAVSEPTIKVEKEFYNVFNGVVLEVSKEEALKIQESEYVKKVYENREVRAFLFDSTPIVRANEAWTLDEDGNNCTLTGKPCINGAGVKIAIIDTGIDYTHADLGGCFGPGCKVEGGYDVYNQDSDPMDDHGHGTHCAGIAAGDGTLKGVAPKAKLYAYKVLSSGGSGSFSDVIEGIERAVDPNRDGDFSDRADVMSLSLGGYGDPDDAVSTAVDNAVNAGVVAVVAAGNSGPYEESIGSPGTARNALTVGATYKKNYESFWWTCTPGEYTSCGTCGSDGKVWCDFWDDGNPKADSITSFSSRGPVIWDGGTLNKPEIVAPGAVICSARHDSLFPAGEHPYYIPCSDEKHVQLAGTSMATPHVAGGAALVIQARPQLTALEVRSILISSADDLGYDINTQGSGRMNLVKALNTSIVFSTNKIDFGNIKGSPVSKILTIKNLGSQAKTIEFSVSQSYGNLVTLSEYTVTVPAKSEHNITATIQAPVGVGGIFSGEIKASEGGNDYSMAYSASRLSELKLKVEGNHFPDFVIYNYALDETKYAEQDWDFIGNEYAFKVSPGVYYVYAVNYYYGETDKYILMGMVNVTLDSDVEKIFRLEEARLFTLDAKSAQGEAITLVESGERLVVYPKSGTAKDAVLSFSSYDWENQKQIYLSNAPGGELDTDIILKYLATADPEKIEGDIYAGGWVLHNLDNSVPTTITFDHSNSAKYNFTFNLPGFGLKYYDSILYISDPGGYSVSSYLDMGAPLTQKVYAYVSNPVPGNYYRNFSLDMSADLKICPSLDNNIVSSYSREYISSYSGYSTNPASKEEKEFYFGGPYFPGSVMTDGGLIIIRNKLLNLKGGGWVDKDSETSSECCGSSCSSYYLDLERPRYQIYENGILAEDGNLTYSYGYWDEQAMNYAFKESKNYFVKFTVPSYYPIFNKTIVSAGFSTARTDRQPPWLTNLEILPRFTPGSSLGLSLNVKDDVGIANVLAYWSNGGAWNSITLATSSGDPSKFTGAFTPSGDIVNLKIEIFDSSQNNQTYEMYPVSYKEKLLNTSVDPISSSEVNPGDKIAIKGYVKDSQGAGVNGLLVRLFSNGVYLGSSPSYKYSSTRQGYFSYYYTIPLGYSGQLNITAQTLATGSYKASSSVGYPKNVTRYNHDVAVMNMTMPDEDSVTIGEIKTAKASIANLGNNVETVTVNLIEDYYDEKTVIATKQVTLNPGQLSDQELSFRVKAGYEYYAVEASISNDENTGNNRDTYYWYKTPDYDVGAYVSTSDYDYYINYSKIIMSIENNGKKDIENISYTLEIAKDCYDEGEICSYQVRDSGKVDYLKEGTYKSIESSAKLQDEGYYMLRLNLSAPQDQYPDNDVDYLSVQALKPSPDASVSFSWSENDKREYIIGIPNNITVELYNAGAETAENINVYLYKYYYNKGTGKGEYTFVDSIQVDSLAVDASKYINFLWTPDKAGEQEFYVNISSNRDSNQWNNYDWDYLTAIKDEIDVNISYVYLGEPYKVNESAYASIDIKNLGRTTKSVNLSFYDNNVLIEKQTKSSIPAGDYWYKSFYWTPTQIGAHKLKFVVETEGDTDTSNNVKEVNTFVYNWAKVTFKLKDSQGNPVSRYIISEDYFNMSSPYNMEEYRVDGEKTFDVLDLSISGEKLPIIIVHSLDNWFSEYVDEMEEGMMAVFAEIPFNKTIEITSDYNDKITEGNKGYYLLFANELAQKPEVSALLLARNLTYLTSQGIGSGSYPAYCEDYNLVSKNCDGYWKAPNYFYSYSSSSYNIRYYEAEEDLGEVEAISVTKSLDFDCETTNLSSQVSGTISNFTLERCPYGRIRFTQPVYIGYFKNYPYYLAQHVKIEPGVLGVNTSEYSMEDLMNRTAQLLFRNIDMRNPQILRDDKLCGSEICSNFNYNKDTKIVTLDVKEFSEFKVVEGPYCGDGTCQASYGEDCADCVADCGCSSGQTCDAGACKSTGGEDGGDSGGPSVRLCATNWNCSWTPCTNNLQTLNCVDKNKCGTTSGKPKEHGTTRACLINKDCIDNDKDGYGIGKDCLGPDINDNDPGITDTLGSQNVENPDTTGDKIVKFLKDNLLYLLATIIIIVLIVAVTIVTLIIVKSSKNRGSGSGIEITEKKRKDKIRKFE